jgi:hypothetical protein
MYPSTPPSAGEGRSRLQPGLRLQGALAAVDRLLANLEALRQADPAHDESGLRELGAQALQVFERISALCDGAGVDPRELPDPTRRAFTWFGALTDPDERRRTLLALRHANAVDGRIRVRFFNTASLYRLEPRQGGWLLTAHQAFIGAPSEVLSALVRLGVPYTHKRRLREIIKAHVEAPAFQARLSELERFRRPPPDAARGAWIDLGECFRRVNRDYFDDALPAPQLAWSKKTRRREFGRYDAAADTVWLNPILDDAHVPVFVADFVVYHELLHKALGVRVSAGRRQVHTPAFRRAERRFAHFAESEAILKRLGETLRRE